MIREFFYLQKSDRKVILTLLVIIVVALGVIFLTGGENDTSNALTAADTLKSEVRRDTFRRKPYYKRDTVYVHTKVVYRDRYYRSGRGYGKKSLDTVQQTDYLPVTIARNPHKIREGEHVVLNTADTTALKTIPGIGPYFARKIVQYGERLGGYVSIDQLDEIDDFPLDSKKYLVIQDAQPRKLNINQLSLNELKRHPYINYYQAKAIVDYRRLHGHIESLKQLSLSKDFPPEAIERLEPYVEY
jgi:DNA uptake protein ComE-like DNA-binding protein